MSCNNCPFTSWCIMFGGDMDFGCEELELDEEIDGIATEPDEMISNNGEAYWAEMSHYRDGITRDKWTE